MSREIKQGHQCVQIHERGTHETSEIKYRLALSNTAFPTFFSSRISFPTPFPTSFPTSFSTSFSTPFPSTASFSSPSSSPSPLSSCQNTVSLLVNLFFISLIECPKKIKLTIIF